MLLLPCSQKRQTHHSGHTSHYHLLQGTSGCAMAQLMSRFANALANANARRSTCPACRSVKLTTVVALVTTTSFKALVGAQWLGLCPGSLSRLLTQTRDAPLALLAGASNLPKTRDVAYVPLHYLEAVEDIYHRQVEYHYGEPFVSKMERHQFGQ